MIHVINSPTASSVPYDNTTSSLPATTVQEAIDFLSQNSGPVSQVDYNLKGAIRINQNSHFNINNFRVAINKDPLFALELTGSVILNQASSLLVTSNGVVSINSL